MRLTQYTDYALRVLIFLALHPDRRCRIQEVAERYQISKNHLMKVAQQLAAAGYVDSARGVGGGLRLGREPDKINLADVIEEMEPDFGLVECLRPDNRCVITGPCNLPCILQQAKAAFIAVIRQKTLADLLLPEERTRLESILIRDC